MTTTTMIVASLTRGRLLRTLISIASIAAATALLTVSLAVRERLLLSTKHFDNGRLMIQSRLRSAALTRASLEQIKRLPGIIPVHYALAMKARVNTVPIEGLGSDPDIETFSSRGWWRTSDDVLACWHQHKDAIIVTDAALATLGWHAGDRRAITFSDGAANNDVPVYVCGASTGDNNGWNFVHYEYLDEVFNAHGILQFVLAECDTPDRRCSAAAAEVVDANFAASSTPTDTVFEQQMRERNARQISAIPRLLSQLSMLAVLITVLTCGSSLAMSLSDRRNEFGTLRALGFVRARVFWIIQGEAAVLCVVGGLLGAGVPALVFLRHGFTLGTSFMENITIHPLVALFALATAVLMAPVVAVLPALRVLRDDVIAAMNG